MIYRLGAGGTERQLAELAKHLDRKRYEPHIAYLKEDTIELWSKQELGSLGIPMVHVPLTSMVNLSVIHAASVLGNYIQKHAIDIVHAYDPPSAFFGVPVSRLSGVSLVLASQRGPRFHFEAKHRFFLKWLSDPWAHGQVVNCEAMRRQLVDDWSIPERKIRLCYNALDTDVFHPGDRKTLQNAEAPVIGVTCVLRREKGLVTLVNAFGRVHAKYPLAKLWIVGSGPLEEELRARAAELKLGDSFTMFPSSRDVPPFLRQMDIFVLPSLYEALSNSLMEAMACGCCAIASRVGGNPELVRHGENGLLFESENDAELAEHFQYLIERPAERERMAFRAQSDMQAFSIARGVKNMEDLYDAFWKSEN